MSGKRAREQRRMRLDRRSLSGLEAVHDILNPRGPVARLEISKEEREEIEGRLDKDLLDEAGYLKVMPNEYYNSVPHAHLIYWANSMGYYCLPTEELVAWLKEEIGDRSAIEICAGTGLLGKTLGVPRSDWRIDKRFPLAKLQMNLQSGGMPYTITTPDVEDLEATQAVMKYKPQVVFGGFVSQRTYQGSSLSIMGSAYGVEEDKLIDYLETYIVIGTEKIHGAKKIEKYPHKMLKFPWLRSRAINPNDNAIFIWNNDKPKPFPEDRYVEVKDEKQKIESPTNRITAKDSGFKQTITRQIK